MASIRRTLSPAYHDRSYQNGSGFPSPSNKFLPNGSSKHFSSSSHLPFLFNVVNIVYRKGWRRSFCRCLFFFVIGFVFGIAPFGYSDTDVRAKDFTFPELKPPHATLRFDDQIVTSVSLSVNTKLLEPKESTDIIEPLKQLIVVTPTYNRGFQAYFLNRLGQVLRLVKPPLVWIVVEEKAASHETAEILRKTGVMYRHVLCAFNSSSVKDPRVHQRNAALEHIERHKLDGIVFFADDDNVYTLELFESLRTIYCKLNSESILFVSRLETAESYSMVRFGTWPVAMLAQSKNKAILEGPVCNASQLYIVGFKKMGVPLLKPNSTVRHSEGGFPSMSYAIVFYTFTESTYIEQVVEDESQMEGIPHGCSRIMNWHLHLDTDNLFYPKGWLLEKNLESSDHSFCWWHGSSNLSDQICHHRHHHMVAYADIHVTLAKKQKEQFTYTTK
ncbi:hypothetical protein GOBAR_AA25032 [Gossypium barbadense]|uniref:Glycosyltransferases n=1 Tax=Gossypium barbadense TaxID=3634 RepID=A0A2P5WX27_GOSBA|nr:hypothetical protein GOBAR_AA25032 [Gossypium barbadense]